MKELRGGRLAASGLPYLETEALDFDPDSPWLLSCPRTLGSATAPRSFPWEMLSVEAHQISKHVVFTFMMKLPVWNLTLSTNHGWENQHSVHVKPAGMGLALEEADAPASRTDMASKGHYNDTEKRDLTFYQQQFSP